MHIIYSLYIFFSLNSIECDAPEDYYIFVIDSLYCFIIIYVTFSNLTFSRVLLQEIRHIILKASNKSCELDPLHSWLLKECIDELSLIVTVIVMHH